MASSLCPDKLGQLAQLFQANKLITEELAYLLLNT